MELSLKRMQTYSVAIQGDRDAISFHDGSYVDKALTLHRGASIGDNVALLMLRDVNGVGHNEIYRISTPFMIKLIRRNEMTMVLNNLLSPYGVVVINVGLYYSEDGVTKISGDKCQKATSMLVNLSGKALNRSDVMDTLPNELGDELAVAVTTADHDEAIILISNAMAKFKFDGFIADIPSMAQRVKENIIVTERRLGKKLLFQVDK